MLIMKHENLKEFAASDGLREFLLSATDHELSVIESALRCFGMVAASVSHTDRNNKITALAILKSVEEARKRWQDPSFFAVENTANEVAKNLSNEDAKK